MLRAILTLVFSILGGLAYRAGGSGRFPRFIRELGQGIIACLELASLGMIHWILILSFGICWAESTYFKKKGTDATLWNWALVGWVFGMVPLPMCFAFSGHWLGFGIRMVVCIALTVLWQWKLSQMVCDLINNALVKFGKSSMGKDITDEFGRGFINISTLPLILL